MNYISINDYFLVLVSLKNVYQFHLYALHGEVAVEGGPLPLGVHLAGVLVVLIHRLILTREFRL